MITDHFMASYRKLFKIYHVYKSAKLQPSHKNIISSNYLVDLH